MFTTEALFYYYGVDSLLLLSRISLLQDGSFITTESTFYYCGIEFLYYRLESLLLRHRLSISTGWNFFTTELEFCPQMAKWRLQGPAQSAQSPAQSRTITKTISEVLKADASRGEAGRRQRSFFTTESTFYYYGTDFLLLRNGISITTESNFYTTESNFYYHGVDFLLLQNLISITAEAKSFTLL